MTKIVRRKKDSRELKITDTHEQKSEKVFKKYTYKNDEKIGGKL